MPDTHAFPVPELRALMAQDWERAVRFLWVDGKTYSRFIRVLVDSMDQLESELPSVQAIACAHVARALHAHTPSVALAHLLEKASPAFWEEVSEGALSWAQTTREHAGGLEFSLEDREVGGLAIRLHMLGRCRDDLESFRVVLAMKGDMPASFQETIEYVDGVAKAALSQVSTEALREESAQHYRAVWPEKTAWWAFMVET